MSSANLPSGYQGLSAQDKQGILWDKISASPYRMTDLPTEEPGFFKKLNLLRPSFDKISFLAASDEIPEGRTKLIHVHGSAAKVELQIFNNSTYTGIFKTGGIGVARLSLAKQDYENFIPGMALKILIDGQRSQNFQVMQSVEGQGSNHNFFANRFSNIISEPTSFVLKILSKAFDRAINLLPGSTQDCPESKMNLGLYEQASVSSDGQVVRDVTAPYKVVFVPNPAVGWDPANAKDMRLNLDGIPSGSILYQVVAKRTPTAAEDIIGQLVTTSAFVASEYEDKILYSQHASKRWRS